MVENNKQLSILFICDWNTARSILAEEIINQEYKDRFMAFSAGVEASDYIDPFVMGLLKDKYNVNLINKEPRNFKSVENLNNIDLIITLSANAFKAIKSEKHTQNFSTPIEFWETPTPPDQNQSRENIMAAYQDIFNEISEHIENRFYSKW